MFNKVRRVNHKSKNSSGWKKNCFLYHAVLEKWDLRTNYFENNLIMALFNKSMRKLKRNNAVPGASVVGTSLALFWVRGGITYKTREKRTKGDEVLDLGGVKTPPFTKLWRRSQMNKWPSFSLPTPENLLVLIINETQREAGGQNYLVKWSSYSILLIK